MRVKPALMRGARFSSGLPPFRRGLKGAGRVYTALVGARSLIIFCTDDPGRYLKPVMSALRRGESRHARMAILITAIAKIPARQPRCARADKGYCVTDGETILLVDGHAIVREGYRMLQKQLQGCRRGS